MNHTDPTGDRTALRDRIADAIKDADYELPIEQRHDLADAVLAVLGEQADRAAVLREAADRIDSTREPFPIAVQNGITWATSELRRLAGEVHGTGTGQQAEADGGEETRCHVEFEGGGRCIKPAGHRPPGSDDPHVPAPAEQQPAADGDEETRPTLRERHRVAWNALTPAEQDARIAALDAIDADEPAHPDTEAPTARPTRYVVNLLPEDAAPDAHVFEITVEWRGDNRWAVLRHGRCLGADGDWDYELRPSEREDDWLDAHRFDLDTALRLAEEQAAGIAPAKWQGRAPMAEQHAAEHTGGNAEDCPLCKPEIDKTVLYPWICRGAEQQPAADSDEETLVHVGWWCWRGDNHGHLATMACRSDNVPIHVPAEWADEMRAVIRRLEDGDEEA